MERSDINDIYKPKPKQIMQEAKPKKISKKDAQVRKNQIILIMRNFLMMFESKNINYTRAQYYTQLMQYSKLLGITGKELHKLAMRPFVASEEVASEEPSTDEQIDSMMDSIHKVFGTTDKDIN